ncbi:MAG: aspartate 1-decarboxylase [Candidatus Omnitrophica bacterium]|nr:aspartate 1-decarboxylase [Candidatus Omnitrophota bacterium]
MLREVLKAKIYYATVTETELFYEGSITLDEEIIEKAGLIVGEKVEVLNLNNGARFQTYIIKGPKNSGKVCLNGPAARLGLVGDKIIILSYGLFSEEELISFKTKYVILDEQNKIKIADLR